MKWAPNGGYTIIEVMIFLAVSAGLFAVTATSISQQNRRTQFTQAVDRLQQSLQDTINDVATGVYPVKDTANVGYKCVSSPTVQPSFSTVATEQGASEGCTFVGKAFQFAPIGTANIVNAYTMVGNQKAPAPNSSREAANIIEARPVVLRNSPPTRPGLFDTIDLGGAVEIKKLYPVSNPADSLGGFAIITGFGLTSTVSNYVTGNASKVSFAAAKTTTLGMTEDTFAGAIEYPKTANLDTSSYVNNGIVICLSEPGSVGVRKAAILVGGANQQLSLETKIDSMTDWASGC
jgi:type II secretory pathway pseudopilin PulG